MIKKTITWLLVVIIIVISVIGINEYVLKPSTSEYDEGKSILTNEKNFKIIDVDGKETTYSFEYKNKKYTAIYTTDNWKIINSYKIKNTKDMVIICQALIDIHPVHGRDMISYRTAEDMAYEWFQHILAYEILPKENQWRDNAKDVDLDPKDQGKSLKEIYEERTGEKFTIKLEF